MKIRNGFVSNSSSSSFICDISGEEVSSWDISLEEAGMYECENSHTFLEGYLVGTEEDVIKHFVLKNIVLSNLDSPASYYTLTTEQRENVFKEAQKEFNELSEDEKEKLLSDDYDFRYEVPADNCPICSFNYITSGDKVSYIMSNYGIKHNEVYDYMKSKNSRLRKLRDIYWVEYLEKEKGINSTELVNEIKSKYNNLEEFYKGLK